jgi:signal transduction histidine kinase
MDLHAYEPSSVNATLEDLPVHRVEFEADSPVASLKDFFDAHIEVPGVIVSDAGTYVTSISRDALFRRLSRAFGREVFLRRRIREFLEVWPQEPLRCASNCTIHHAVELALERPGQSAYDPILVAYPDGSLGLVEMHALLVAQSQVLALTRMVEEQRQAAEAANRSKSEFLANISHELRTPLHGIASYARFGRDEVDSAEPAELLTYFAQIEQCTDTLLHLVNDLLDLSKMEAGKMRFDKQEAILSDLIEGVVDEFNSLCAERDLRVVYTPAERETFLFLDPERIKQVVRNLLSNAVKFSSPGGRVTVRLRRVGNVLLMSVCDQGPGIPPEELETIFDKFVQSSKTKSGSGGTGLGLAICREIVMGHEGRIWAENNQGPGATFYCELPLSRDPVAEEVCEDADGAVIV